MKPFMTKIIDNAQSFAKYESEKLPAGLTAEQVFSILHERADENRELMRETNDILDRWIAPVLEHPEDLSDEEADELSDFAQALYTLTRQIDIGLALPLHNALLRRARARGDKDRILRHLYWTGMIQMQWDTHLFMAGALQAFEEAAAYKDEYFSFEDRETRLTLNKCIGNVYVATSGFRHTDAENTYEAFFRAVDIAATFWNDPAVRERDPDFPWEAFLMNAHQNICAWMDKLRSDRFGDGELSRRVYESVLALYGKEDVFYHTTKLFWPNSRTAYLVYTSKFHVGLMSEREHIDALVRLAEDVKPGDYSRDALYRVMHVSFVALTYMEHSTEYPMERRKAYTDKIIRRVMRYCRDLPSGFDRHMANTFLSAITRSQIEGYGIDWYIDMVLRMTTFSHLPTYVHSVMVGKLMALLAGRVIQSDPQRLINVCGARNAGEVTRRGADIIEKVRLAGLAHDVGKMDYVNTVALCSRRINEYEFTMIKEHTRAGHRLLNEENADRCVADVVAGHHKWYDGSQGYPREFDNLASPFRFVIDLASVADSIDAATDTVGRSYAPGHSLRFVVNEIIEQAGTRYSPFIADMLKDEGLIAEMLHILTECRKEAYYAAYLDLDARMDAVPAG